MTGESHPLHISNLKRIKKMDKKFYEMPEIEVVDLELEGALLSDSDGKPAGKSEEEGTDDDF